MIAQIAAGSSLVGLLEWALIIGALVAIVVIALRAMGVQVPEWAKQMFWVVVIVVIALLAIRIVMGVA